MTKAQKAVLAREKALGDHIRSTQWALNPASLARSYMLPESRVVGILKFNGRT